MMSNILPPGLLFLLGALLIPVLKGKLKSAYLVLLPVLGLLNMHAMPHGASWIYQIAGYELILGKVDKLALVFGYVFHIGAFMTMIYMLQVKRDLEYVAGFLYAGAALGVLFAGDLFSFFVFWEMLTIPAALLVFASGTKPATAAAFRYIMMHVLGGVILLAGIMLHVAESGSIEVKSIGLGSIGSYLMFLGMGVNAAWPLLHSWLIDSYPKATIGGTVILSAFTTKTAVYALARTFPGAEPLIWIGSLMVTLPVFFAVIENDLRKVLSFSLINQVGYMMIGIGIGTTLSLNGVAAHAFCHIIYKALLFMSMGAVLHRVGSTKATDLGGLFRSMPITCTCCIIGAASISGFPLTSGFVSKAMVVSAAAYGHMLILWFVLLFASAGVLEHAGIKVPFFAFFSHDSGKRVKEAPMNMLIGMGIAAFLCIFIGVYPDPLYSILPYEVDYKPYTIDHVLGSLQLLVFAGLAFCLMLLGGVYPAEKRALNLDSDWLYRGFLKCLVQLIDSVANGVNAACQYIFVDGFTRGINQFFVAAPQRIATLLLAPFWILSGLTSSEIAERRSAVETAISNSTVKIGATCAATLICVWFLYILR